MPNDKCAIFNPGSFHLPVKNELLFRDSALYALWRSGNRLGGITEFPIGELEGGDIPVMKATQLPAFCLICGINIINRISIFRFENLPEE